MSEDRAGTVITGTQFRRMRPLGVLASIAVALLILVASPSGAQTTCNESGDCITEGDGRILWNLREGIWIGEAVSLATMSGTVERVDAEYSGGVGVEFVLQVDDQGAADGDWIMEGNGIVDISGDGASGRIILDTWGDGQFSGRNPRLTMSGTTTNSGVLTTTQQGQTFTVDIPDKTNSISEEIELTEATCFELTGDWLPPLEEAVSNAGWVDVDIDGFFYAYFLGDDPDDSIFEEIDELVTASNEWGDALVDDGAFDGPGAFDLIFDAKNIIRGLAETEQCLYDNPVTGDDPAEFMVQFLAAMAGDIAAALNNHTFDGTDLYDMSLVLSSLGVNSPNTRFGALRDAVSEGIQSQAQRIISENVTASGEACSPCVTGNSFDVRASASAGHSFGHTYEVDGQTFTARQVAEAATP